MYSEVMMRCWQGIGPTDKDLEESVREDVQKLRESPLIPKQIKIYGFIYDVKVGSIHSAPLEPRQDSGCCMVCHSCPIAGLSKRAKHIALIVISSNHVISPTQTAKFLVLQLSPSQFAGS